VSTLTAYGLRASLPDGFEGRIFQRVNDGAGVPRPIAQFATFALPADTADFGGGAVTHMRPHDVLVVLFEYGPESVGQALFARRGLPRPLQPGHFRPYTLRRGLPGQSGSQWFFTEQRRPFTLYCVLGSHARRTELVPAVNRMLGAVTIDPLPAGP